MASESVRSSTANPKTLHTAFRVVVDTFRELDEEPTPARVYTVLTRLGYEVTHEEVAVMLEALK